MFVRLVAFLCAALLSACLAEELVRVVAPDASISDLASIDVADPSEDGGAAEIAEEELEDEEDEAERLCDSFVGSAREDHPAESIASRARPGSPRSTLRPPIA